MKIEIYQKELVKGANIALRLTGGQTGFRDLKLMTEGNAIIIQGYDGSHKTIYKITDINKFNIIEPGYCLVPSTTLLTLVRGFGDSMLSLELKEKGFLHIRSLDENIKTKVELRTDNAEPDSNISDAVSNISDITISIPCGKLSNIIHQTLYAHAKEDARQFLRGIFVDKPLNSQKVTFVATDAKRIGLYVYEDTDIPKDVEIRRMLPDTFWLAVKSILPSEGVCHIMLNSDKFCKFVVDNIEIYSPLITTDFLNYNSVIPKNNEHIITFNKNDLVSAINRVKNAYIASFNKKDQLVLIRIKGDYATLKPNDVVDVQVTDVIAAVNEKDIEFDIAFNYGYVLEAAAALPGDNIQFRLATSSTPAILTDGVDEYPIAIVAPMRYNGITPL